MFGIEGRYAHAMYSAAAKQNNLEKVESELSKVDELIRSNQKLSEYLANPTLDKYKKQCKFLKLNWAFYGTGIECFLLLFSYILYI